MITIDESILIIGTGDTNYKNNTINKVSSLNEVSKYGDNSQLYNAYLDVLDFIKPDNLYMLNMLYDTDYPEIIDSLIQSDFTYIVPLNIKFSDKIIVDKNSRKKMYYPEYILRSIGDANTSSILMTDNHASLYEDLDAYIDEMEAIINNFKGTSLAINRFGRNLCFIANNLSDYKYANLVIACMLASSQYKDYPLQSCGEAVFDIDYHDISLREFCFFKYNIKRDATIENFYNFSPLNDQDKFIPINRVIKYLQRSLDLSEFCGRLYNGYQKILVRNKLDTLLSDLIGVAITDYEILSCEIVKNVKTRTIVVLNTIAITPINSLEKYVLTVEAT